MLFMLINRTRPGLTPQQYEELGRLAQAFYDQTPPGIRLLGDWAALDRSRTFALLEAAGAGPIDALTAPFAGLVDIEVVPVAPVAGWGQG